MPERQYLVSVGEPVAHLAQYSCLPDLVAIRLGVIGSTRVFGALGSGSSPGGGAGRSYLSARAS